MTTLKKEYERQIEDISTKMGNAEEHQKEISRQQVAAESEFEKEKALLD